MGNLHNGHDCKKDVTSGSAPKLKLNEMETEIAVLHIIPHFAWLEAKAKQCSTLVNCTGQGMKLAHSMAKPRKSEEGTHSMS